MIHKRPKKSFRKEFKRQTKEAIIVAIGFTIAFAWREAIFDTFNKIISKIFDMNGSVASEHYTALAITLVGVLAIYVTSKLLRD